MTPRRRRAFIRPWVMAAIVVSAVAILLVVIASDGGNAGASESQDTAAICDADRFGCVEYGIGDPVKLGALLWLGPGADPVGIDSQRGIELAIDYLDGAFDGVPGEVLGHGVDVVAADEGCDPRQGRAGARTMASEPGMLGVVGTTCSGSAVAAAPLLSDKGILLVSSSNTAPRLTEPFAGQPFYARTAANDAIQGAVAADFAAGPQGASGGGGRALVIHAATPYSAGLAGVFARQFDYLGGEAKVRTLSDDASVSKVASVLRDESNLHPDIVYFPVTEPLCGRVIAALVSQPALAGAKPLTSDGCLNSGGLGDAKSNGLKVFASGPDLAALRARSPFYAHELLPAYLERYGERPPAVYHANAFDAANLIFDALRRTAIIGPGGTLVVPRTALRNALFETDGYPGVSGTLECQPTGDCAQAALVAVYQTPDWPVEGGGVQRPIFKEYKTLAEVLATT